MFSYLQTYLKLLPVSSQPAAGASIAYKTTPAEEFRTPSCPSALPFLSFSFPRDWIRAQGHGIASHKICKPRPRTRKHAQVPAPTRNSPATTRNGPKQPETAHNGDKSRLTYTYPKRHQMLHLAAKAHAINTRPCTCHVNAAPSTRSATTRTRGDTTRTRTRTSGATTRARTATTRTSTYPLQALRSQLPMSIQYDPRYLLYRRIDILCEF